jgi:GNAT superfamily N-acetyltransferase
VGLPIPSAGPLKTSMQLADVWIVKHRLGQAALDLIDVDPETFLGMVHHHTASDATEGGLHSQYEKELRRGDPSVRVLGLSACGTLVGAVSFGSHDLRLEPDTIGGRIDVVVTKPHCRGLGVGSVLVAVAAQRLVAVHGERLRHLSTIAVHPTIASLAEQLGFERVPTGKVPLYTREISAEQLVDLTTTAEQLLVSSLQSLRAQCIDCKRKAWVKPWCLPEPAGFLV